MKANGDLVPARNQRSGKLKRVVCCITAAIGLCLFLPVSAKANACSSLATGNWNTAGTWTTCGGVTPQAADTVTINNGHTVTINTSPTIAGLSVGGGTSGTLTIGSSNTNRTLTVTGNVTVNSGATFNTAGDGGNVLNIRGNLTNNGTFDMNIGSADADVTFNGTAANQTVSGTGGTTDFNLITINNTGAANNNIVEVSASNFSAASGFLTLTQGIFKVSGSFTFSNTCFAAAAYAINANSGIWLNNANVTVTGQAGDPTLSGLLRLTQGTYNVGTGADNDLIYATGSTIDIQGGALNVAGALQGTTVSATGTTNTTTYSQSGGTVTVATVNVASDVTAGGKSYGSFDIHAAGSSFTISGGAIVLQNPTNVQNDYVVGATLGSVTGGKLQTGNASTTIANPYAIFSSTPVFDLTIKTGPSAFTELLLSSLTVKGDLLIEPGARFDVLGLDLAVAGNWTNNGTFTNSGRLVTFNGGSNRNVGGSGTNGFANLTMNGAGITLTAAASVSGTLTLTNGKITTGTNTLTLGSAATTTGASTASYVIGNLKKTVVPNGNFTFPVGTTSGYTPLDLTNASGGGDLTVTAKTPQQPLLAAGTSLQEYWTLTKGGTLTADLTFNYLQSDVAGSEANYRIIRVESGTAVSYPNACPSGNFCVDTGTNRATIKGVSSFSDWTIAEPAAPTAVKLMKFAATSNNGEVMIQWQTGLEARNLGYHIYREQGGKRIAITPSLVAGSALIAGRDTVLTAGLTYTWYDHLPAPSDAGARDVPATYWLEDVDLNGTRTLHGPIAPSGSYPTTKAGIMRSAIIGAVSRRTLATGVFFSGWPGHRHRATGVGQTSVCRDAGKGSGCASQRQPDAARTLAAQTTIAATPGVKLAISKSGWYRVTQPELAAAGLAANANAAQLQLFANAQEVPLKVSGDGLQLTASDYIEFYGQGLNSATDAAQTYYLIPGNSPGQRIGTLVDHNPLPPPSGPSGFDYTVERQERMIYFSGLLNGDAENFFGQIVRTTPVSETVPASQLDQSAASSAQLEVALQGVTGGGHTVQVLFNGTDIGTMTFANTDHPVQTLSVPAAALLSGDNLVQLAALGGAGDVSLVDTLRLTYRHAYVAENNALSIGVDGAGSTRISGFTSANVRVVDLTDPANEQELTPLVTLQPDNTYAVDLRVAGASVASPHTLIVFADEAATHPDSIQHNNPSTWSANTNSADYLIITTSALVANVEPLAAFRRGRGMQVSVVDVEDLYDEFSFGTHAPQAIRDFLQLTVSTWQHAPHYVLLAGDSSYDPKNYFGQGLNDLVPTKLIDTTRMETASDDWFADFDNDGIAELAIGRLPVRSAAETSLMVNKIINYQSTPADPQRGALFVADRTFEAASSSVQNVLPANLPVQTINRSSSDDTTVHDQIVSSINQGPRVTNYFGHGSNGVWTSAPLLSSPDAPSLTNTNHLSVFTMMTCFNGYFQDAYNDSLAEALLKSPGGAVAVWASTSLTEPGAQSAIDEEFYRQLFGAQAPTLGDAVRIAKYATGDADVRRTWTLFGDPAMSLSVQVPTAAPGRISGRVTRADGSPAAGVTVTLSGSGSAVVITDANGNYQFDSVDTNSFYTVTPSFANYHFSPGNRSFSLLGSITDAVFTAIPDAVAGTNAIDSPEFFVRQQYADFLGREPDPAGFNYWSDQMKRCAGDADCLRGRRLDVSAAFFMSPEFQETGSYVYRLYQGALGRQLSFAEFSADQAQVFGGPGLDAGKTAFANAFVARAEFARKYQANTSAASFVGALLQTLHDSAGVDLSSERANLINQYSAGRNVDESRGLVVRALADHPSFGRAVYNPSFVLMQYFGYLRRDAEPAGYDFWLNVISNGAGGDYRGMVCSFITSAEYQRRFGSVVTRSNAECSRAR